MRRAPTVVVGAVAVLGLQLLAPAAHSEQVGRAVDGNDSNGTRAAAPARAMADFDGDGHADLAVGVRGEVVAGAFSGAVNVIYGSGTGLTAAGNDFWHQDSPGVRGVAGDGDDFAAALGAGDFDGDGYADLAIGAPFDTADGNGDGVVNVLYGSASGLTAAGDDLWHADKPGVKGDGGWFGSAVTAGDFDGDGFDELAVGAPAGGVGFVDSGQAHVLRGSATGLTAAGDRLLHQDTAGVKRTARSDDFFGSGLAAANFGRGQQDDLVIWVLEEESRSGNADAGGVHVLYGGAQGLRTAGDQYWNQDTPGVPGDLEFGELFGRALATADLGRTFQADLAIGVPFDSPSGNFGGAVHVLYGSPDGLKVAGTQYWHPDSPGVRGESSPDASFGLSLAAADFGGTPRADLAVGEPFASAGAAVHILSGSPSGLTAAGDLLWRRQGIGRALFAADMGRSPQADLAAGLPSETVGGRDSAGAVVVRYGSSAGLAGRQLWSQDSPGIRGVAETFDSFGDSL